MQNMSYNSYDNVEGQNWAMSWGPGYAMPETHIIVPFHKPIISFLLKASLSWIFYDLLVAIDDILMYGQI